MSNYKRMLLLENGRSILIRDSDGNEITFISISECLLYTGHDFNGKFYVGYEPELPMFKDSVDDTIASDDIPYQPYEEMILNIQTYIDRKDDQYYGLSTEDKRLRVEADALVLLDTCYTQKKIAGGFEYVGKESKLIKALRKETKNNASVDDVKMLDDNDTVDDWYSQLETDMEVGESWIEDPTRTTEELEDFDPYADVTWTEPPVL